MKDRPKFTFILSPFGLGIYERALLELAEGKIIIAAPDAITDEDILEWKNDMMLAKLPRTSNGMDYYPDKIKTDLQWQREENKKYHTKEPNKDKHHNPFRTHANSHSSKINNRERSKKKRKNKRRHK